MRQYLWGFICGGVLLICLTCYFLLPFFLFHCAGFLVYEKPTSHADVIVVLSGDNGQRVAKAAELYHQGVAPFLLMSGGGAYYGRFYVDMMADYAEALGVPASQILFEPNSLSTRENAQGTFSIIQHHQFKRVLIVTSYFHTRRAYRTFSHFYFDPSIHLFIEGADDQVDYRHWYRHYEMAETILIEWAKLFLYFIHL